MQSSARAVVLGGGIFGASVLHHLAKEGWSDVVLLEKGELASGTTWHAAGQCPNFIGNLNYARVHEYGIKLYQQLEAETGQSTGWHGCGSVRLARNKDELDWHKWVAGIARQIGVEQHVVGLDEIRGVHPLLSLHDVVGGSWSPNDGHVDPTSATNALAIGARQRGATVHRRTRVTGIERRAGGEWRVTSDQGSIDCEHLILATGFFSRRVGQWLGLELPLINMVHQYLMTEPVPQLEGLTKELPILRDPGSSSYIRHEQRGFLGGPYETRGSRSVYPEGVPWSFEAELLEPELDRIEPWLEQMVERLPLFGSVGIRRVVSGFIAHTPDLMPMLGPAPGHENLWLACGAAIGIAQGPGCGKYLAQWIVHGAAEISMLPLDPRRYGPVHTPAWVHARTHEATEHLYEVHPPGYEFHAGRPLRTSPIHADLQRQGAVFGEVMGWERPKFFARPGEVEIPSFSRNNAFEAVASEHRAVREKVGLLDLTSFSKFEVTGPDAASFLGRVLANAVPKSGRIALSHMLAPSGETEAEFTVTRLSDQSFYLLSAASAQLRDFDGLNRRRVNGERLEIRDVTEDFGCLVLAGPRARELLAQLARADLGSAAFPWLSAREIEVAGVPTRALRVSYAGELGWELHHPIAQMPKLYQALVQAGGPLGLANFGLYALNSLRMEKAYRSFGTELSNELTLIEADMERFVDYDKGDFVGRAGLLRRKQQSVAWQLAYLSVEGPGLDVIGSEPVYANGEIVGTTTSGAFGHSVGRNLAFAYLRAAALSRPDLSMEMLGERYAAAVQAKPLYDPMNERLRG